ncbi:hypothetical protein GCM10010321_00280 [Streptomyces chartreusis]|nr:hypothetical protein GCM10010321_00280 [Streptomyces chartreusis]
MRAGAGAVRRRAGRWLKRKDLCADWIPPVRGRVGRPRRKPDSLFADRGYGHDIYRDRPRPRHRDLPWEASGVL